MSSTRTRAQGPRGGPLAAASPRASASAALIALTSVAAACLMGVRPERAVGPAEPARPFCPPRWAAADDPRSAEAAAARAAIASDLPGGASALLPDREVRLSRGCTLALPVAIEPGQCVLYAAQVIASSGRPSAVLRVPSAAHDGATEHLLDHGMAATFGAGADPVCYDDDLDGVVEVETEGEADLVWVQAWRVGPEAAAGWAEARRRAVAAQPGPSGAGPAAEPPVGPSPAEADGGPADAGPGPDAGFGADGGQDQPDAGPGVGAPPDAGPDPGASPTEPAPTPEPEPEPPPPLGPLAVERGAECGNGLDDDEDGRADCEDPDCAGGCASARQGRLPWLRVLDLRLGAAGRIGHEPGPGGLVPVVATGRLHDGFDPLAMRWGLDLTAAAVWRPSPWLGLGLDVGLATSSLGAYPPAPRPRDSELRVAALALSVGLGLHVSIPFWIVEVGGTVGLGWMMISTSGEVRSLSGEDLRWQDDPAASTTSHHPHAAGQIWADFWIIDALALGLYGGVLAPLTEAPAVPAIDYHAGLRTTLRLDLR